MALDIEQVIRKVAGLKTRAGERDGRAANVLAVRQGKIGEIYPDFFPEGVDLNVVANFVDTVARDLSEVMAPLPTINCSAANMANEKARTFADKRTRIASNYFVHSDLAVQMYEGTDHYVTYGFTVFIIEVDDENKLPKIRVEDSYMAYPAFDRYGRCTALAKRYILTVDELVDQYPEYKSEIRGKESSQRNSGDALLEIIRYWDADQSIIYVPERTNLVISKTKNPIGRNMVVVAKRPGVDKEMRGQFDDVLGIQLFRNRFAMLAMEAAEKSIQAPIVVPNDVIDFEFGPDALLRTNNPQGVRRVALELPQGAFTEQASLNQEMRTGARYPDGRSGQVQASVITGQGVQALMGAFDTQVKSAQMIYASALRDVIEICFMVDEKVYDVKKTIRGVDAGSPYSIEYRPSKDINGDHSADVRYGMLAGLNPAQGLIFMLQAIQADLISNDVAMRELPFNVNVTQEQEKIEIEKMRKSLLSSIETSAQAIPQMIAQGQDPSELIRRITKIIQSRKEGLVLEEAFAAAYAPEPAPPQASTVAQEPPAAVGPTQQQQMAPQEQPGQGSPVPPAAESPDIQNILARLTSTGKATGIATVTSQNKG